MTIAGDKAKAEIDRLERSQRRAVDSAADAIAERDKLEEQVAGLRAHLDQTREDEAYFRKLAAERGWEIDKQKAKQVDLQRRLDAARGSAVVASVVPHTTPEDEARILRRQAIIGRSMKVASERDKWTCVVVDREWNIQEEIALPREWPDLRRHIAPQLAKVTPQDQTNAWDLTWDTEDCPQVYRNPAAKYAVYMRPV